jgi:hypothetical protein
MRTDPRGKCFISYKRSRVDEARLLVESLRDFGVPTWQDIENLPEECTEDALRRTIEEPTIASAILWITPEVEHSPIIRQIEAPGFLNRARNRDGFYLVPVLAGGVDFSNAGIVVDPRFTLENIPGWNLLKAKGENDLSTGTERVRAPMAASVACKVFRRRVEAIHSTVPAEQPLVLRCATRTPPARAMPADLVFDWRHRFEGRHAKLGAWETHICPALRSVSDAILEFGSTRLIVCEGQVSLAGAAALGAAFLQPLGLRAAWRQEIPGREAQLWSLADVPSPIALSVSETGGNIVANDLAVLVSINANAESGFAASRPDLPAFRAIVHVHGPEKRPFQFVSGGEAVFAAQQIVEAIKAARDRTRYTGTTHLFICGPAGLAFLIGQLCNQLMPLQTYEFDPEDRGGRYSPAATIRQYKPIQSI